MINQSQDVLNPTEPKEQLPEYSKNGVKIGPKYEAFQILRENGLNPGRASQALGMSKTNGYLIDKRINKKYDLTSTKYIKLASTAVKSLLQAQPFGTIEKVKDSTVLQAAQMVYDRVQPLIQRSININASIMDNYPVDLSEYYGGFHKP